MYKVGLKTENATTTTTVRRLSPNLATLALKVPLSGYSSDINHSLYFHQWWTAC